MSSGLARPVSLFNFNIHDQEKNKVLSAFEVAILFHPDGNLNVSLIYTRAEQQEQGFIATTAGPRHESRTRVTEINVKTV